MPNYGPVKKAAVAKEKELIVDLYYKHGKTMKEIEHLTKKSHGFVQGAVSKGKPELSTPLEIS